MVNHLIVHYYPTTLPAFPHIESKVTTTLVSVLQHFRAIRLFEDTHLRKLLPMVYYRIVASFPTALSFIRVPIILASTTSQYPELLSS